VGSEAAVLSSQSRERDGARCRGMALGAAVQSWLWGYGASSGLPAGSAAL